MLNNKVREGINELIDGELNVYRKILTAVASDKLGEVHERIEFLEELKEEFNNRWS